MGTVSADTAKSKKNDGTIKKVCDEGRGWKHELVGDWLDTLMKSNVWPSLNWSFFHKWMASSPLTLSETWKASIAGKSIPLEEWTASTGNGDIACNLKESKYYDELMAPALERAAGSQRPPQPESLGPEFFGSSIRHETLTKTEKKNKYKYKD